MKKKRYIFIKNGIQELELDVPPNVLTRVI